jgi:hypothetical protein
MTIRSEAYNPIVRSGILRFESHVDFLKCHKWTKKKRPPRGSLFIIKYLLELMSCSFCISAFWHFNFSFDGKHGL